ncbi:MAG: 2'-5' RNA ligase family protein [Deinococcus sp.]
MTLYGLVAWPSPQLDGWLREQQRRLGVASYGPPHLNLRVPFTVTSGETELTAAVRSLLEGVPPFTVAVGGWRIFPGVVFLGCDSPEVRQLHDLALELPGAPPQPHDQKEYIPHFTLALGVLPWARDALCRELECLEPPVDSFPVSALSLLREGQGELHEVHTFPLERG